MFMVYKRRGGVSLTAFSALLVTVDLNGPVIPYLDPSMAHGTLNLQMNLLSFLAFGKRHT